MRISMLLCWIVGITLCLGCESSGPSEAAMQSAEVSAPPPPTPAKSAAEADDDAPPADAAAPATPAAEAPAAPTTEPGNSERATVGAGAKGRDYGGPGFVTTPIEALFRADDLIVFETHIPKNLSLYKAEHDNKGPKTHEEFMQVIIKDGGVRLPELPQGDEYWYDPKTEQLMVRHPKPAEQ
jgi:hypothetical protein